MAAPTKMIPIYTDVLYRPQYSITGSDYEYKSREEELDNIVFNLIQMLIRKGDCRCCRERQLRLNKRKEQECQETENITFR